MSDERRRVLDMLAEEKITVEDAERLLRALNSGSYIEDRVQEVIEEGVEAAGRLGETLAGEMGLGDRKQVTVVLDEENETHTHDDIFEVGDTPRLDVRSSTGLVSVSAGEPGSIRVLASLKDPSKVEYSAVQEGDTIKVEAKPRGRSSGFLAGLFGQQHEINIEAVVPAATSVDLGTSNGLIELSGIEGGGVVKTSNARIQVERSKGALNAETINGRIAVEGFEGSAELTTTNGRVSIREGRGQFAVTTSNGRIDFEGSMEPGGKNRLITTNGRIDVVLDSDPSLKVTASTVNGRAKCETPGFVASVDQRQQGPRRHGLPARELEGTVGAGEAELVAKTVNGSITVQ